MELRPLRQLPQCFHSRADPRLNVNAHPIILPRAIPTTRWPVKWAKCALAIHLVVASSIEQYGDVPIPLEDHAMVMTK